MCVRGVLLRARSASAVDTCVLANAQCLAPACLWTDRPTERAGHKNSRTMPRWYGTVPLYAGSGSTSRVEGFGVNSGRQFEGR
jgi:hypothetical protein